MGSHWYGDDWYRLEYRPQPDWMFKMANVLRELETFRLEFLGDAKTEVVGEKGKIYAVTPTPPGSCSFQFLYPSSVPSGAEGFLGILHMPSKFPNGFRALDGKRDMSGCRSSFNIEAAQQLEKLTSPFQCCHFGHRFGKTRRETRRMSQGRSTPRQDAVTITPAHGAPDRGMYVQTCAERPASHLMPLEP